MDKLIPIFILIGIILLGFIMKVIELNDAKKRADFTKQFYTKFIRLTSEIFSCKTFNQQLYYELTLDVKTMQYELGSDGVYAYVTDNLKGFSARNYQLLINFLPELRDVLNGQEDYVMMKRCIQTVKDCNDMFIRHLGSLNKLENSIRKNFLNPFSCFSGGMRFIVSLPILLLNWFGILSDENTRKVKRCWVMSIINIVIIIVGLFSSIMSIILGWGDFLQKISQIF